MGSSHLLEDILVSRGERTIPENPRANISAFLVAPQVCRPLGVCARRADYPDRPLHPVPDAILPIHLLIASGRRRVSFLAVQRAEAAAVTAHASEASFKCGRNEHRQHYR